MKRIPDSAKTETLKKVASAVVWYDKPETTLNDPVGFVLHALEYATPEQICIVIDVVGLDGIREALKQARPGILSKRSWAFWHAYTGSYPPPEMPTRDIVGQIKFDDHWPI